MKDETFARAGAVAAFVVAASSVLYAVSYLIMTPADQRSDEVDKFFVSFADDPTGRQLANIFFITAGLAGAFAVVALAQRLRQAGQDWALFAAIVGVVANLAGMVHGLWNLSRLHELSKLYETPANQAAVDVLFHQPSPVDPLAVFRFAIAGIVAVVLGALILQSRDWPRPLGWVGIALGVDTIVLFSVSWAGSDALVLVSGALASLILLPAFWIWTGSRLWRDEVASVT